MSREQTFSYNSRGCECGCKKAPMTRHPTAVNIVRDLRKQGRLTGEPDYLIHHLPALLAAIDELTTENKELKLDLAAAEHYTTDDLTSPARLCVKCRCPWPCEFTSV